MSDPIDRRPLIARFAQRWSCFSPVVLGLAALWVICCGCYFEQRVANPNLASVRGIVTLDGKPLPNVEVRLVSSERQNAMATTDSEGRFEPQFDTHHKGALIGNYKVEIVRNHQPIVNPRPELPERYNSRTELKVRIEPGENVLNFELEENEPAPVDSKSDGH